MTKFWGKTVHRDRVVVEGSSRVSRLASIFCAIAGLTQVFQSSGRCLRKRTAWTLASLWVLARATRLASRSGKGNVILASTARISGAATANLLDTP